MEQGKIKKEREGKDRENVKWEIVIEVKILNGTGKEKENDGNKKERECEK